MGLEVSIRQNVAKVTKAYYTLMSLIEGKLITDCYRYQWMDKFQRDLRKRWDNVPHFPNLPNFPHHIHVKAEENVQASNVLSIMQVLDLVEDEFPSE
jgi:hypothetical protein